VQTENLAINHILERGAITRESEVPHNKEPAKDDEINLTERRGQLLLCPADPLDGSTEPTRTQMARSLRIPEHAHEEQKRDTSSQNTYGYV